MPIPLIDRETAEPQTLDEIRDWHHGIVDALVEQRASIQHAIRQSSAVAPRFVGMTEGEVNPAGTACEISISTFALITDSTQTSRQVYFVPEAVIRSHCMRIG